MPQVRSRQLPLCVGLEPFPAVSQLKSSVVLWLSCSMSFHMEYDLSHPQKITEELLASDLLVIASPMWNFGIPSSLKAWIDRVVRAGKTFNYAGAGVEGLAKGKKAILALASGGVFSEGPWKPWDTVEPYLRQILGFIGIDDVQTVRAEGMNIPPLAIHAIPNGERAVEALAI